MAETGNGSRLRSSRGLISSVIVDAQRLVALEIALARQELKELAVTNAIAAGLLALGALLVVIGVLVALPSLEFQVPQRTLESLKENKEWTLRRMKSNNR